MKPSRFFLVTILGAVLIAGCSSGNPVIPSQQDVAAGNTPSSGRILWGLWEIQVDPGSGAATVVPARFAEFHANVRKFLEESPCTTCLKVVPPIHLQPYGMDVTIAVRHPFPGNAFYTGFDVRGIVMLEGSFSFPNLGLLTTRATAGDPAILNPDGFTRVFNAVEYTLPGIMGYSRGKMVSKIWPAPIDTLNAFKAFYSVGQSENEGGRRGFAAGDEIQKTYQIQIASGKPLRFWYAVDASWEPPTSGPPYDFTSFPQSANCPEAYRFDFSVVSGELYPTTGSVKIGVNIWDHQGWSAPYSLSIEAPECSNGAMLITDPPLSVSGEEAYWEFDISNDLHSLNPSLGAELAVVAINNDKDPLTGPIDGAGRFTIPVTTSPTYPIVTSIDPPSAIQDSVVNDAIVTGDNFLDGATVRFEKSGQPNISVIDVVFQDSQHLLVDFNLKDAAVGKWDVVVENPTTATGVLPEGFEVLPQNGCNDALHNNVLGKGDYNGGTNMVALDSCFAHNTGHECDGEILGYISGFAGTVVTTYDVDTTTWGYGHGFGGGGWGNPHIGHWPTPNSVDVAEESGRFFISWSDTPAIVEVWDFAGQLSGTTDASDDGRVFSLDTDGHGGFWDGYFPHNGFACGIKHFIPGGPFPGTLTEKTEDTISLPEVWGTPYELICIPDKTLLILTGYNRGKVRAYDISTSPPFLKGEITNLFSGELDFGSNFQKPCDMEADWSDPTHAFCRIIAMGNIYKGDCELVRIDTEPSILAGPVTVPGHWESIAINPKTRNVTLWPERDGSPGSYELVEVPSGW